MHPVHVLEFNIDQKGNPATCAIVLATIKGPTKSYLLLARGQMRWQYDIMKKLNDIDTEHRKRKPLPALVQHLDGPSSSPTMNRDAKKQKSMSPAYTKEIDNLYSNITDPRDGFKRAQHLRQQLWDKDDDDDYPPPSSVLYSNITDPRDAFKRAQHLRQLWDEHDDNDYPPPSSVILGPHLSG